MPETTLKETIQAYFDNEVKIDVQQQVIGATGRGTGITETWLNSSSVKSPLSPKDFEQLSVLFVYSTKSEVLEPLLKERDRLARKINYTLMRVPNKKVQFTRKVVQVNPPSTKDVPVFLWSDGTKLLVSFV